MGHGDISGALHPANIANIVGDMGDQAGARNLSEQSLRIYREVGDYTGMGETLNNIAAEQIIAGDFDAATKTFRQSLEMWRRIGHKGGMATALNNLGDMLLDKGDLAQAKTNYQEALSLFRDSGQTGNTAYPLSEEGDLAAAREKYGEALATSREAGDKHESACVLFGMASVIEQQGDLSIAHQRHEKALAIREEIGEKSTAAESLLALADLALEDGHPKDTETTARQALDEFQTEKLRDDEILARVILGRELLAQGNPAEARKQIDLVAALVTRSPVLDVRLRYAIDAARVRGATDSVTEPGRSLEASLAEARKHCYVRYQYEVRLALGEIEMRLGKTAVGHGRLDALEKEARATGLLLIARIAAVAKSPSSPMAVRHFG